MNHGTMKHDGRGAHPRSRLCAIISTASAGVMGGIIAWEREVKHLRSADIRRIPYVGNWLADHVHRWRDDCPRKRAASAAERRARVSLQLQGTFLCYGCELQLCKLHLPFLHIFSVTAPEQRARVGQAA